MLLTASGSSLCGWREAEPRSCACSVQSISVQMDENTLHEILNEVDLNKNGQVELNEFLQVRGSAGSGKGCFLKPQRHREGMFSPWFRAGLDTRAVLPVVLVQGAHTAVLKQLGRSGIFFSQSDSKNRSNLQSMPQSRPEFGILSSEMLFKYI